MAEGDFTRSPYWLPTTANYNLAGRVASDSAAIVQEVRASQIGYQGPTSYGLPTVSVAAIPTANVVGPATVAVATLAGLPTVALGTYQPATTPVVGTVGAVVPATYSLGTYAPATTNVVPPATVAVATLAGLPSIAVATAATAYVIPPATVSVATLANLPSTLATVAIGTWAAPATISVATVATPDLAGSPTYYTGPGQGATVIASGRLLSARFAAATDAYWRLAGGPSVVVRALNTDVFTPGGTYMHKGVEVGSGMDYFVEAQV